MSTVIDTSSAGEPPLAVVRSGQLLRVPKKLARAARHKSRLNALAVWSAPGDAQVWLEVRAGGLLRVTGRVLQQGGKHWRKVCSPDGVVEGFALESSLQWLDLVDSGATASTPRKPKPLPIAPTLFDWAYVGVRAPQIAANLGQCVAIDYDYLPNPDHLGLATFRMLDGRHRRAWLIHAQKTQAPEELT